MVFSTKEKLGWSSTVVNLKMQGECLQMETNLVVVGMCYSWSRKASAYFMCCMKNKIVTSLTGSGFVFFGESKEAKGVFVTPT